MQLCITLFLHTIACIEPVTLQSTPQSKQKKIENKSIASEFEKKLIRAVKEILSYYIWADMQENSWNLI